MSHKNKSLKWVINYDLNKRLEIPIDQMKKHLSQVYQVYRNDHFA